MTTVIVTGSRHYADRVGVWRELNALNPSVVVTGDAEGADALARQWARTNGRKLITYAAHWSRHGKKAGPLRNGLMLRSHPGATVLAFPLGGPGTADCMKQARRLGMTVLDRSDTPGIERDEEAR